MPRVLTFGETMLRLSPPGRQRLAQARALETWVAGSESNVAAALGVFGVSTTWVSRLPDNPLGRRVAAELCACGVDVSSVAWRPPSERLGTFYVEAAASPRPAQVLYDRANSAASGLSPRDLPDALFLSHRHLHVSGITPALSPTCAQAVADSLRRARTHGLTVSLDVNYRAKLWGQEQAREALTPLLAGLDVLVCSQEDAARVFGVSNPNNGARTLRERFGTRWVVVTAGSDGAMGCDGAIVSVPAVPVEQTVERLGSGDAFTAGVLAAFVGGFPLRQGLQWGVAAAALKRTIPGDILTATRAEVEAILSRETPEGWR